MGKRIPFDKYYPVRDDYERFDERKTAFQLKNDKTGGNAFNYTHIVIDKMRKRIPGFSIVDFAFKNAAETYTDQGMNNRYYSWEPLGMAVKPKDIPRWEASPEETAKVIKKAALFYGAVSVGFTKMDKRWIYSHTSDGRPIIFEDVERGYTTDKKVVIPESHRYVIALTIPMEFIENSYAPTTIEVTSNMGYSRMHVLAGTVAEFLRGLGWNAIPCGNDTALSVPIAIQAGLGHMGRNSRLITWERGPLVRICKIFTDLPLPQSPPAPSGIIEFCEVCTKCAKHCPSKSIPEGPRTWRGSSVTNANGVYKWYCNEEACFEYWHKVGTGCSICYRVCNFTKKQGPLHDVVKWIIRNTTLFNKMFVWADDMIGYGKMSDPSSYWDKPFERS